MESLLWSFLLIAGPPEPESPSNGGEPPAELGTQAHAPDEGDAGAAGSDRELRRARLRERWANVERVFTPTALLEADYRQRADEVEGTSGFALSRGRFGLRLMPTDWMVAVATVEFVGDHGPYLLDGYASFTFVPWLELTVGYSKPPLFASFRYEPVHTMPMPMRSPVVTAMWVRRDVGVETRFRPRRAPIEAILHLGNGAPGLLGNDNNTPTGYAALDLVLGRAWIAGRNSKLGLRLGAASLLDDAEDHDSIAGRTPLGFTYARPVVAGGLRTIAEAHLIGYAGPVRLMVEGAMAYESRRMDDDGDAATSPVEVDASQSWGVTGELAWTIRGDWRQVGAQPSGPGRGDGRWDGGAVELAGRVDRLWLGRGTAEVADAGGTTGSLSLKWWPTDVLALDLYGDATRFDVAPVETPDRVWSWTGLVRASFFWRGVNW